MRYTSTRDKNVDVSSSWAIAQGISADGGLFVPVEIPKVSLDDIAAMANMSYVERAKCVLSLYLTDFTAEELAYCVEGAYGDNKFSSEDIAPIHELKAGEEILELWRGPTCAFKDMALQMLPRLMTVSVKKAVGTRETVILVATSGDTGKAALEGFKDVEGTKILVFYPDEGVSPMQKLQMTTQEGSNVAVCAIKGNFDDAQTGVKTIFTDKEIGKKLAEHGMAFSSANSINWGRLVPQIVYYFSAYCDMIRNGRVKAGDKINFVVPTGNFGNILAAYYAREMGLPVDRLICASNKNRVLTDFFDTGVYDINRSFYTTSSPSMDILVSSNLERLLFDLSGGNDEEVRGYMEQLSAQGRYEVSDAIRGQLQELYWGGFCDEAGTAATIAEYYKDKGYLIDTHTAVAANVMEQYRKTTGDEAVTVFVSTASPYKFCNHVLTAIGETPVGDGVELLDQLNRVSGVKVPRRLAALKGKQRRFDLTVEKQGMDGVVLDFLK